MSVRLRHALLLSSLAFFVTRVGGASASEPGTVGLPVPTDEVSTLESSASEAEAVPVVPIPADFSTPPPTVPPPAAASGPIRLKSATGRFTMLAGQGDDLGMDMVDGEIAFTLRDLESLTLAPSGGVVFLNGPHRTDLPSKFYTTQLELRWFGQLATPVFYELAFMPAIFTDGENLGSDALRLQGRAVGYLAFSEQTQLVLGATYLDREDVPILPVFGLLHTPRDDLKLELVFPRPRLLKRVSHESGSETWGYVAGELGGGSWAIERRSGTKDVASYRDFRVLIGLEQRQLKSWTGNIEAGYAFGRELEYESERGDYSPDNTLLLRLALSH